MEIPCGLAFCKTLASTKAISQSARDHYARDTRERTTPGTSVITPARGARLATGARPEQKSLGHRTIQKRKAIMTAEDTTPSEREAPQRFACWHPRSADLGRHKARRRVVDRVRRRRRLDALHELYRSLGVPTRAGRELLWWLYGRRGLRRDVIRGSRRFFLATNWLHSLNNTSVLCKLRER